MPQHAQNEGVAPTKWQVMLGNFQTAADRLKFVGSTYPADGTGEKLSSSGYCISNANFGGGEIECLVRFNDRVASDETDYEASIIVGYDPASTELITAGLGGAGSLSKFHIALFPGLRRGAGWSMVAQTPFAERDISQPYRLKVRLIGSALDLFADDVHVISHNLSGALPARQSGVFARSSTGVTFEEYKIKPSRKRAFVVMQFTPEYNDLYAQVIRPVAESVGLECIRADEFAGPGIIISDIERQIHECDVVIAEITPENCNVFYEVGYAHATGKPTILIAQRGKVLPFDVSAFRTLFYENTIVGKHNIELGLRKHLEGIL